ncbi:MAG TPA: PDZ domain-containing protein, partial [Gemmatimonadaceae bacterium]
PAKRAGIERGDVITAINGKPVETDADLQRMILDFQPGETVDVTVMRYGQEKTFKVKLGRAPSSEQVASNGGDSGGSDATPASTAKLGLTVEPVTREMAQEDSIPAEDRGVVVTSVDPRGSAYRNLAQGLIITQILGPGTRQTIRTPEDLNQALKKFHSGDVVSLLVYIPPQHSTRVINVPIGE